MSRQKPERIELHFEELMSILDSARACRLSAEDYEKLKAVIEAFAWMTSELEEKNVTIKRLRRLFGTKKSEKTSAVLEKNDEETEQQGKQEKQQKKKRKGHGRNGTKAYKGAEKVKVPHESLKSGNDCPDDCEGKVYLLSEPRRLVLIRGQAPIQATVYEFDTLRCNLCNKIYQAKAPEGVAEKKKYDETAASMIAMLKYGTGVPFNRLEKLQGNLGIPLPASTQWDIVEKAAEIARVAHEELIQQAAQGEIFHNDDTSMKILELIKENERLEQMMGKDSKRRTGMNTSGIVAIANNNPIALLFTGRKHAGENLTEVLKRRASQRAPPIQMCDGASRNEPKEYATILANCVAHARRKFVEVTSSFPQECRCVLEILREVYKHDATARKQKMSAQERLEYHQAHSSKPMNDLKRWLIEQIEEKKVEPNSSLGRAISYMHKRWDKLTLFLREPGAPLDNNICERVLKMAILHRKNALFYKTENGARVGDIFMSSIYTAELSGVNPFDYLTALLKHEEELRRSPHEWMPWNYKATIAALAKSGSESGG
jgi:transposase